MRYIESFLELNCSCDILEILKPFRSGICKEISETWSMLKRVRSLTLTSKNKYNILDICAGNPLFSVTSAFLLPVEESVAVDKHIPDRDYSSIQNFKYLKLNIHNDSIYDIIDEYTILVSIHPCKRLATRIVDIYNKSKAQCLFMMPCCIDRKSITTVKLKFLIDQIGKYKTWVYHLSSLCEGKVNVSIDNKCLSIKNCIISASKI